MLTSRELALRHSQTSFYNSYIRDLNLAYDPASQSFAGPLFSIPVKHFSVVGAHEYAPTDFLPRAQKVCSPALYKRLENSVHNLELALETRSASIQELYSGNINFLSAEQGLQLGHNFHPTPKSRDEFSDQDQRDFAPEFGARFPIYWYFLKKDLLWEERSQTMGTREWQADLFTAVAPEGFVPYPAHPWQRKAWQQDPVIQRYLSEGLLKEAGPSREHWYATSSLRSLYSPAHPFMVKFSMTVRLTNSIRHLQVKEVSRGMQVQDAFHTKKGLEFSARFPYFRVMHEPLWAAIKDPAGKPLVNTVVLLRENPFQAPKPQQVAVLATLTQDNPLGGKNLLAHGLSDTTARAWFDAFIEKAVVPLFVAQADYGIMLGAHQQNLLLELKNGLPVGCYFRDCQGTGFSSLAEELLLPDIKDTEKFLRHLVPAEAAKALFGYYFIINSVFNTIAALSKASGEDERQFISLLQQRLLRLRREVRDPSIIEHLLTSKVIAQKGNFRCCNEGLNENTTENPLSIYNDIPNPLFLENSP